MLYWLLMIVTVQLELCKIETSVKGNICKEEIKGQCGKPTGLMWGQ